jgi:phage gp45-like
MYGSGVFIVTFGAVRAVVLICIGGSKSSAIIKASRNARCVLRYLSLAN